MSDLPKSNLVFRRENCRLCASTDLSLVLTLTPTPPANAFIDQSNLEQDQPCFPLDVYLCNCCAHVQLLDVVNPDELFRHYVYVSGTSPSFVAHFDSYADKACRAFGLGAKDLAIDIGSNDGTLLQAFKNRGLRVLGIDPAEEISRQAAANNIPTRCEFFTHFGAKQIVADTGKAAVVCANNVFAHADDLTGIVAGVRELLKPEGVFIFEVSYLLDVLKETLFDTIYHEHLSYHSVIPLKKFFHDNGMELIDTERMPTHGGSLRATVQLAGGPRQVAPSVKGSSAEESAAGLDKLLTFVNFADDIARIRLELTTILTQEKRAGRRVVGFGAPAKATTLLYHFGIDKDIIDFIVDDSPHKQNLYSPGMHIPVVSSARMYAEKPETVVILAWNFADSIIENHKDYLSAGRRFIVPLPNIRVVEA